MPTIYIYIYQGYAKPQINHLSFYKDVFIFFVLKIIQGDPKSTGIEGWYSPNILDMSSILLWTVQFTNKWVFGLTLQYNNQICSTLSALLFLSKGSAYSINLFSLTLFFYAISFKDIIFITVITRKLLNRNSTFRLVTTLSSPRIIRQSSLPV